MNDKETLIKRIKSNKTLQKEMLKYNSKQWEMYLLYAVSVMLMFIGFIFTMINLEILGYIMMVLIIPINIWIILSRNKVTHIAECKVKQMGQAFESLYYTPILEEIREKHTDIFKYQKFDNWGRKNIYGFEGIVFAKVSKNTDRLSGKQRDDFIKQMANGDEEARKMSNKYLNNTSISDNDKVIAFKTVSGNVFVAKENGI